MVYTAIVASSAFTNPLWRPTDPDVIRGEHKTPSSSRERLRHTYWKLRNGIRDCSHSLREHSEQGFDQRSDGMSVIVTNQSSGAFAPQRQTNSDGVGIAIDETWHTIQQRSPNRFTMHTGRCCGKMSDELTAAHKTGFTPDHEPVPHSITYLLQAHNDHVIHLIKKYSNQVRTSQMRPTTCGRESTP